jgi:hypothetical protein
MCTPACQGKKCQFTSQYFLLTFEYYQDISEVAFSQITQQANDKVERRQEDWNEAKNIQIAAPTTC